MDHDAVATAARVRPESQGQSSTAGNKGFLGRIESVRGLAPLCVALTHAGGFLLLIDHDVVLLDRSSIRGFVLDVFYGFFNGATAVILFFVISGVVIVSLVGLPLLSRAGVNFARRRRILHVAWSSAPFPVERIRLHDWTRPSGPIVSWA